MHTIIRKAALYSATCLGTLAALSSPAYAQKNDQTKTGTTAPATDDTASTTDDTLPQNAIVVTGSRLGKTAVEAQPTLTVSGGQLVDLGYTNIGKALTENPIFGVPGNSNAGSQGSFGAGQTFVNMYDLGAQRTLTLVNGNRFVSSGSSSIFGAVQGSPVDLGQIAPGLVDHIDTISVGGAPIYGSDAIAGTVNVVLKKDFEGLTATGSYGLAAKGDAPDYNLSVLAGKNFNDGRGNITLNLYFDHQKGLPTSARSATNGTRAFYGVDPTGTYSYARYSGGRTYSIFTNTGMPMVEDYIPTYSGAPLAAITNDAGQTLYFNKAGALTTFNDGTALGNGITEAGGDGFRIADYGNLLTNNQRFQGTLLANYEFSDALRFHGEFWLGRSKASNIADQPFYNTYLFADAGETNGNLILSTDNPYLSAADQATIKANLAAAGMPTDQFYMARANTDLSTGAFTTTTTLVRGVAGFDGDFNVGSHHLTWEATLNYGRISSSTKTREIVTQNYNNALDAVLDSSGNIVCAPGYTSASIPTLSSTCAPLDIFGVGNESQAALDYITALAKTHQINTQLDIVADVKGDLLTLPAGKVQFVLGYEHRRESQNFNPGDFYRGELQSDGTYLQYGNSIPITPVSGSYNTDEGFTELTVPLISRDMDVPLIHALNLHGAARYTDNSYTGGFWSYTGGGTLETVGGLSLRGNYTRSFRSPAVTELFAPVGSTYETANDPCDSRYISSGPNPSVRAANCAAAGLPADFQSNIVDYTAKGTSGGNSALQNELAKSWTAGVAFAPSYVPGLSITADYVSIDISNEITSPGMTALMDACYDSPNYPDVSACDTFTRDSSGQVTDFQDDYFNIAIEKFRAVQATMKYMLPLEKIGLPAKAGMLNLSATWLHTTKHYYRIGTGDLTKIRGAFTDPVDAVQGNIDWATKKFDWLWQVTYNGPSKIDPNAGEGTYEYPRMGAYWMVNTSVGVKVTDQFSLRLVVNNVFNLGIPSPYTTYSSNKYFDALMGRYMRLNATVNF